jgi:hypothetical protein
MKFVVYHKDGNGNITYLNFWSDLTNDINDAGVRAYSTCMRYVRWLNRSDYWSDERKGGHFGIMEVDIEKKKVIF